MDPTSTFDADPQPVCAAAAGGGASTAAFRDSHLDISPSLLETERDGLRSRWLCVRATADAEGKRKPLVVLAILDNSGSMAESAGTMQGAEGIAFTRMDLVKHAVKTVAALLGPADQLGLISFSTDARVLLEPVYATADGRSTIDAALSSLVPDASTNIFAGIRAAATIANKPHFADSNIVAMLLTDGFPNVNPPRGIVPSLKLGQAGLTHPWTLFTFGFGYSLDSALLAEIAEWGGGGFGFIPDCSMVGTVFINAIAHLLTTAHKGTPYSFQTERESGASVTGPVAFGQPRVFLHAVPATGPVVFSCEGREVEVTAAAAADTEFLLARQDLLDTLATVLAECKAGRTAQGSALLEAFYERHSGSTDRSVKALLADVSPIAGEEGQVHMAPAYFARWGEHYLRSYLRAQQLQQCMNFKDAGLQIYGGDMFHRLQNEGDTLFCTLPPPTPTGRTASSVYGSGAGAGAGAAAAPVNMAIFHNASAGCFAPGTLIRLADGSQRLIQDLAPGLQVATPTGPATIRALVTCGTQRRSQPMTQLGELHITPWHPIRLNGTWHFPADLGGFRERLLPVVYNLVLNTGHIVYANDYEACTLAHGFNDSPIIQHDFFGTERVLMDLAQVDGWANGRPTFQNLVALRDPDTGVICAWRDVPF